jgi:hypothetical protein
MRFMVMVKATPNSEAGVMPEPGMFEAMMKYNEALVNAGIMQAGDGLQPSSKGARVQFSKDGKLKGVVDGPFPETKELVAGFWMWKCKSREEAMEWAKKCPSPMPGEECEIEVRQVYEMEDFGDAVTPEVKAQEERLRAKTGQGR